MADSTLTLTAAQIRSLVRIVKGQSSSREILLDGAPGWAATVELPELAPAGSPTGPRWRIEPDGSYSALNSLAREGS